VHRRASRGCSPAMFAALRVNTPAVCVFRVRVCRARHRRLLVWTLLICTTRYVTRAIIFAADRDQTSDIKSRPPLVTRRAMIILRGKVTFYRLAVSGEISRGTRDKEIHISRQGEYSANQDYSRMNAKYNSRYFRRFIDYWPFRPDCRPFVPR